MKTTIFFRVKRLLAGIILLLPVLLANGAAAEESWQGRLLSNVNLRQAPGLSGQVICGLHKGSLVAVLEQRGNWYRVAQEQENFGYFGWVYAKYVARTTPAAVLTPPLPSTPLPAPVVAPADQPAAMAKAISTSAVPGHTQPAPVEPQPSPQHIATPAPVTIAPGKEIAPPPAATVAAGEPKTGPEAISPIAAAPQRQPETVKPALPRTVSPPPASVPSPPRPAVARSVPAVDSSHPPRFLDQRWVAGILRPVVRLLTVFLSCMALIISCRTLRQVRALSAAGTGVQKSPASAG